SNTTMNDAASAFMRPPVSTLESCCPPRASSIASGEAGDPTKNLGVVVLLVPQKNHRPGTGQIFIATGRGAEGFLTDARVGRLRDAMTPYLAREEYGAGLAYGVVRKRSCFPDGPRSKRGR